MARWWCVALLLLVGCAHEPPKVHVSTDSGMPNTVVPQGDGGSGDDGGGDGGDGGDGGVAACDVDVCDPTVPGTCGAMKCFLGAEAPLCGEPGSKTAGMACTHVDDCAPGLACWKRGGSGVCAQVCCEGGCAGEGERCGGDGILVDGTVTTWQSCIARRDCDLLDPAPLCEDGEGCYVTNGAGLTDCLPAGTAAPGDACVRRNDCEPGLLCLGLGTRVCRRVCALEGPEAGCPMGEGACVHYAYSPPGTGICTATP